MTHLNPKRPPSSATRAKRLIKVAEDAGYSIDRITETFEGEVLIDVSKPGVQKRRKNSWDDLAE